MTATSTGYVAIARTPRIPSSLCAGAAVRLAAGIIPFSTVVAFARQYGFTYSGLASAGFMLAIALLGPQRGRLFDRYGTRVLAAGACAYALLVIAAALTLGSGTTPWAAICLLTAAGGVMPPINASLRTRWSQLLPDKQQLQQIHALDSILEEITFVVAPLLTTVALSVLPARVCMAVGGVIPLIALALLWLGQPVPSPQTSMASADAPATGRTQRPSSLLRTAAGLGIVAPIAALGLIGGSLGVLLPATAADAGHITSAGYLLALFSVGGVIGGYFYGKRTWVSPLRHRYLAAGAVLTASTALVGATVHTLLIWPAVLAAGFAITPLFVIAYLLVDQHLAHRQTEANSWISSGYNLGSAGGAAACGTLLSRAAPGLITLCLAALALLCVACAIRLPAPPQPRSSPGPPHRDAVAESDA